MTRKPNDQREGDDWKPQPVADPRLGALAEGRYRVLRRLGEGGMGIVYEAEHVRVRRLVALKVLRAPLASERSAVERFQREAFAATAIGDRHIVEVLDMGHFEDGAPFLVMERLVGEDLQALLAREAPLSPARVLSLLTPLCRALERAHAAGIVHRDLKPSNLMLCRDGQDETLKVLDFGISKMQGDGLLTEAGQRLGTPAYMAPEQRSDASSVDGRADLYSVGVLLHAMLTGELPRAGGDTPLHVAAAELLRRQRPELPQAVAALLSRTLAPSPAQRPAHAGELLRELCAAFGMETTTPFPFLARRDALASAGRTPTTLDAPGTGDSAPIAPRRAYRWLGLVLLVLALALAFAWPKPARTPAVATPASPSKPAEPEPAAVALEAPPAPSSPQKLEPAPSPTPTPTLPKPRRRTADPTPLPEAPLPVAPPPELPKPTTPAPVETPEPAKPDPLRRELLPISL